MQYSATRIKSLFAGLFSFAYISFILNQSHWANGRDAYWYLVQLKSLTEHGTLHAFELSLVYPVLYAIHSVVHDSLLSFRITLALVIVFTSSGLLFVFNQIASNHIKKSWSLTIAFLVFFSPTVVITGIQYPKQALAEGLLLFAIGFFLKYRNQNRKTDLYYSLLLMLAAALSHRMVFGIAVIGAGYAVFKNVLRFSVRQAAVTAVIISIMLVISVLTPGVLHVADFSRLTNAFAISWSLPALTLVRLFHYPPLLVIESFGLFFLLLYFIYQRRMDMPLLVLLGVQLPLFDFFDLQIRLVLAANLFNYISFFHIMNRHLWKVKYIAAIVVINIVSLWFIYEKDMFENNYESAGDVVAQSHGFIESVDPELVIAHKGLDKFMEISMSRDVLGWAPDRAMDYRKIYRYVYNITKNEIVSTLDEKLTDREIYSSAQLTAEKYLIIREDVWERFILAANASRDEELQSRINHWKNPGQRRPAWLKKNR